MKVLVHDFGAYPFPFELSSWLARQGHEVMYNFFSDQSKVRGVMRELKNAPKTLQVREIILLKYDKYNFVKKALADRQYGKKLSDMVRYFRPDVVISADTPLDAQAILVRTCEHEKIPFVYWLQDLISVGIAMALEKKKFPLRGFIAGRYDRLERSLLQRSAAIVASSDMFINKLESWRAWSDSSVIIENWCPLDEIQEAEQRNEWSVENGMADVPCVMYSGSLGLKHDPDYFLKVAHCLKPHGAVLAMVAEGPGVAWLKDQVREKKISNVKFFDFQPYGRLSEVLASASILLATNSASASQFCFPSKVLTYMCAGRAILLSAPAESYIARTLKRSKAGLVVDPSDDAGLKEALRRLFGDDIERRILGGQARAHAVKSFDIEIIGRKFEGLFGKLAAGRKQRTV